MGQLHLNSSGTCANRLRQDLSFWNIHEFLLGKQPTILPSDTIYVMDSFALVLNCLIVKFNLLWCQIAKIFEYSSSSKICIPRQQLLSEFYLTFKSSPRPLSPKAHKLPELFFSTLSKLCFIAFHNCFESLEPRSIINYSTWRTIYRWEEKDICLLKFNFFWKSGLVYKMLLKRQEMAIFVAQVWNFCSSEKS